MEDLIITHITATFINNKIIYDLNLKFKNKQTSLKINKLLYEQILSLIEENV